MVSLVATLAFLSGLVSVYSRVLTETGAFVDDIVDDYYPSRTLALVHDPSEQEVEIHKISESVLQVTKELLSLSPRAGGDYNSSRAAQISRIRQMHPRSAAEVLRGHGIAVPPHQPPGSCSYAHHYRTMDGSCNNLKHPCWGKADEPYQRWLPPVYANGLDHPRMSATGRPLPSPRLVYQWVSGQLQQTPNSTLSHLTSFVTMWGQMVAHDMILTPAATIKDKDGKDVSMKCCKEDAGNPNCFPVHMNYQDGFYQTGHCMEFSRSSAHVYNPKSCSPITLGGQREQMNQLTSFLDASLVYGSSEVDMRNLREDEGTGPKLMVDAWKCPVRKERICRSSHKVCDRRCFHAGEKRANENPVLASLHTVWVREHNHIVDLLSHRGWSNDTVFHVARKIVGALMQHITYSEYLPAILGPQLVAHMRLFSPTPHGYKYDDRVDPSVYNVFAATAFRFGHSMVDSRLLRKKMGYSASPLLSHDFFSMDDFCEPDGDPLESLLEGQAEQRPQGVDCIFSKQITQHLFADRVNGQGLDLFSINIQRGRDHGIAPYTKWREACHITPYANDYSDLRADIPDHILDRIQAIYGPGGVHEIDLFVGGVSELPVNGGILGRTFTCIISNQFLASKFGDRFWYENTEHPGSLTPGQIAQIQKTNLAGLLCRNSNMKEIQKHAFFAESLHNPKVSCEHLKWETSMDFNFW